MIQIKTKEQFIEIVKIMDNGDFKQMLKAFNSVLMKSQKEMGLDSDFNPFEHEDTKRYTEPFDPRKFENMK